MSKKILAVHLLNDFSGSPLVLANCIDSLTSEENEVELLTSNDNGFLSRCNCNRTIVNYKRFNNKLFTLVSFLFCQLKLFLIVFLKTFFTRKANKPKVLINTILPFGAALGAKFGGCHIVYYVHEISIRPLILKRWLKFVLRKTANEAIYVSNYLKENEGVDNQFIKEVVIYNSLPPKLEVNSSVTVSDEFMVFMPSSLKKYKGVYDFVEIATKLQGTDTKFVLALNSEENEFNAFVNSFKPTKNLEILRRPEDINAIYNRASLVLNLSDPDEWVETFGMTVIEGFAYGCPAIVPTVGGITEIIQEGVNGFKISVNELDDICNKITKIMCDNTLKNELITNARKTAGSFGYQKYKKIILEVL